mgnify:CR=1 FL=1
MAELVRIHIHPWDITPSVDRLVEEADPPDLFGLFLALLLITALWIGLNLATAIVEPLGSVISVAEQVRAGNLSERVPKGLELEEVARLGLSFNNMLDENLAGLVRTPKEREKYEGPM